MAQNDIDEGRCHRVVILIPRLNIAAGYALYIEKEDKEHNRI